MQSMVKTGKKVVYILYGNEMIGFITGIDGRNVTIKHDPQTYFDTHQMYAVFDIEDVYYMI